MISEYLELNPQEKEVNCIPVTAIALQHTYLLICFFDSALSHLRLLVIPYQRYSSEANFVSIPYHFL